MSIDTKPTYEERNKQLHDECVQNLCVKFLDCYLRDISDIADVCYETTDGEFMFQQTEEPVMSEPCISRPSTPTGNYKWRIERAHYVSNYPSEPDFVDFYEVEGRFNYLVDAIRHAIVLRTQDRIKEFLESEHFAILHKLDTEYAEEIYELIRSGK